MTSALNGEVERPRGDTGAAWLWILALGVPMFAAVVIDRDQTAVTSVTVITYGIVSVASFAAGAYMNQPIGARTWVAVGLALSLFVVGDVVWYGASESAGTAIYIAAYISLGIGLVFVSVSLAPDRGSVVDALLISFAVAALDWEFTTRGSPVSLDAANFQRVATLVVFPALDAALITLTLICLFRVGTLISLAAGLFVAALGITFLFHVVGEIPVARDSRLWTAVIRAALTWGYGFFAAAALHPSMRTMFSRRLPQTDVGPVRIVLVAAAPLIPTALLIRNIAVSGTVASPVVPVLTAACFALSGVRLADLLNVLKRVARRERAASQALREQNARLEELNEMKQSFMSMISHELRTPLTSIVGYLEFLREGEGGELNDEQAHFVSVIDRNADRLQRLVDEILLLGRADEGRLTPTLAPVDIAQLVRRAAESADPVATRKHLTLSVELDPELPQVTGDRRLLAEALDNLISNAVKFTPAGGSVVIRARPSGGGIEIAVEDTGVGIPADEVPRLFERFFRASTASVASGTGLGLPIVRSIADVHGGSISVDSVLGRGSTFRLRIPLAPPVSPEPRAAETLEA